jgi:hypothetical protein
MPYPTAIRPRSVAARTGARQRLSWWLLAALFVESFFLGAASCPDSEPVRSRIAGALLATAAGWSACLVCDLVALAVAYEAIWRMRRGLGARRLGVDYGLGSTAWVRPVPATLPYRAQETFEIQAYGSPHAACGLLHRALAAKACGALAFLAFTTMVIDVEMSTKDRCGCPIGTAKTACNTIRSATTVWKQSHPSEDCPTLDQLRQDKNLDRGFVMKDVWGNPFKLTCETDDIVCTTAGPDKKEGTQDDIIVPPPDAPCGP